MSSTIRTGVFVVAASLGLVSSAGAQDVGKACKDDSARFCPGLKPGSGEFIACIKSNKEQLSPGCKEAVAHMKGAKEKQAPPTQQQPGQMAPPEQQPEPSTPQQPEPTTPQQQP